MTLCAACGRALSDDVELCPQHPGGEAQGWAAANRIMCDFLHRGIAPPRLGAAERGDDLSRHPAAAA